MSTKAKLFELRQKRQREDEERIHGKKRQNRKTGTSILQVEPKKLICL